MTGAEVEANLAKSWNTTRGKVCGLIEAANLPEKQERALISLYKQLTYDAQAVLLRDLREWDGR